MDVIDYLPIEKFKEERHWKLIVFVPFFVIFIVLICLLVAAENRLCYSKSCQNSTLQLHKYIDENNDPCDNFYDYACGNFLKTKNSNWTNFADSQWAKSQERLKDSIRSPLSDEDTRSVVLQKQFFQACRKNEDGDKVLLKIFRELGGWPVLEGKKWNQKDFDVFDLMVKARLKGDYFQWFLNVSVERDWDSPQQKEIIRIDIPWVQYIDGRIIPEYLENLTKIAVHLGAEKFQALEDLKQMIMFEKELYEIVDEIRKYNLSQTQIVNIENIMPVWPKIYWLMFLSNITQASLSSDDAVVLVLGSYLQKLGSLVQKTDKRTQANYILYQVLLSYQDFLSPSLKNHLPQRSRMNRSRNDLCIEKTRTYFQYVSEADFTRKFANEEQTKLVKEILENICCALRKTIKNCQWMDEETKEKALIKLANVRYILGAPKEVFEEKEFDKIFGYHKIKYYSNNPIEMMREINRRLQDHSFDFSKKKLPKEKMDFLRSSASVTGDFLVDTNTFFVPAGIFQPEFATNNQQNYLNYGTLGIILAHSMVHGFGLNGSLYIENNRVTNWWSNQSKNKFLETVSCLPDENLEEDFADHAAINVAFEAYQEWVFKNSYETSLQDLRYDDPNQLFFTKYATLMCEQKQKKKKLKARLDRIPEHYTFSKIIRTYSNSKYFAKVFNCKKGSKMNPKKKCTVF